MYYVIKISLKDSNLRHQLQMKKQLIPLYCIDMYSWLWIVAVLHSIISLKYTSMPPSYVLISIMTLHILYHASQSSLTEPYRPRCSVFHLDSVNFNAESYENIRNLDLNHLRTWKMEISQEGKKVLKVRKDGLKLNAMNLLPDCCKPVCDAFVAGAAFWRFLVGVGVFGARSGWTKKGNISSAVIVISSRTLCAAYRMLDWGSVDVVATRACTLILII